MTICNYGCSWLNRCGWYVLKRREYWINKIEEAWGRHSIVWLSGVRRAGKTCLSQCLPEIEYLDCELPRVRQRLEDPEGFLSSLGSRRLVLDEIHRLANPSELLKIAADHYPAVRIVATGSSRLGASFKFKDTLAGRKSDIWLTPMNSHDLHDFNAGDLKHRLLRGGLPPFFLAPSLAEGEFQSWVDAFWSKDIQELFRLERRYSFNRFFELLMLSSGGIFEATRFAGDCEASRQTITNYLSVLEETFVAHVLRPFHTRKSSEIVSSPKVYAFDTGFTAYWRGWYELRREDMGLLWEHFVLNELNSILQGREIRYWRDKQGHEIDFVIPRSGTAPLAIECKWSVKAFDPANLQLFRKRYPDGENLIVCADVSAAYKRNFDGLEVCFSPVGSLSNFLEKK